MLSGGQFGEEYRKVGKRIDLNQSLRSAGHQIGMQHYPRSSEGEGLQKWHEAAQAIDREAGKAIGSARRDVVRNRLSQKYAEAQESIGVRAVMEPQVPGALPHPRTSRER